MAHTRGEDTVGSTGVSHAVLGEQVRKDRPSWLGLGGGEMSVGVVVGLGLDGPGPRRNTQWVPNVILR